mgnify:CR=1 FL=1
MKNVERPKRRIARRQLPGGFVPQSNAFHGNVGETGKTVSRAKEEKERKTQKKKDGIAEDGKRKRESIYPRWVSLTSYPFKIETKRMTRWLARSRGCSSLEPRFSGAFRRAIDRRGSRNCTRDGREAGETGQQSKSRRTACDRARCF